MWTFVTGTTSGASASQVNKIMNLVEEAAGYWGRYLDFSSGGVLDISVNIVSLDESTLAQAGTDFFYSRSSGDNNIYEAATITELATGVDLNGGSADIEIDVNLDSVLAGEFFYGGLSDPNVPFAKYDLFTVLLHEIAHGLGFLSLIPEGGSDITTFDEWVGNNGAGNSFFGPSYSSNIALADDPSHVRDSVFDLMNSTLFDGERILVSAIDAYMLMDAGLVILGATAGDDSLYGFEAEYGGHRYHGGDDSLNLLEGDDIYYGLSGNDQLYGGPGSDTLFGGADWDQLWGGIDNDFLDGGGGDDEIRGEEGDDTLSGGAGDDFMHGSDGVDTASYLSSAVKIVVDLLNNIAFENDGGQDRLWEIENIIGSNFNDELIGDNTANVVSGMDGRDTLFGHDGADTLSGGSGNDSANGGDGDDSIDGGLGDDYLVGSTENDTISGDDGDDLIYGGSGNDVLFGGAGEEYISGGVNNDIIDGGDGDDELAGGANNDSVMGGDGNDLIYGAKKVDTLEGGAGNDTISGAADNDFIDGGADDDTLFGGRQNDLVTGGTGDDLFLYKRTNDYDVITDFTAGAATEDVIQLNNFGAAFDTFAEVMAAAVEITGDTYIDFGDGDIIILQGVLIADLHQDDFTFG